MKLPVLLLLVLRVVLRLWLLLLLLRSWRFELMRLELGLAELLRRLLRKHAVGAVRVRSLPRTESQHASRPGGWRQHWSAEGAFGSFALLAVVPAQLLLLLRHPLLLLLLLLLLLPALRRLQRLQSAWQLQVLLLLLLQPLLLLLLLLRQQRQRWLLRLAFPVQRWQRQHRQLVVLLLLLHQRFVLCLMLQLPLQLLVVLRLLLLLLLLLPPLLLVLFLALALEVLLKMRLLLLLLSLRLLLQCLLDRLLDRLPRRLLPGLLGLQLLSQLDRLLTSAPRRLDNAHCLVNCDAVPRTLRLDQRHERKHLWSREEQVAGHREQPLDVHVRLAALLDASAPLGWPCGGPERAPRRTRRAPHGGRICAPSRSQHFEAHLGPRRGGSSRRVLRVHEEGLKSKLVGSRPRRHARQHTAHPRRLACVQAAGRGGEHAQAVVGAAAARAQLRSEAQQRRRGGAAGARAGIGFRGALEHRL